MPPSQRLPARDLIIGGTDIKPVTIVGYAIAAALALILAIWILVACCRRRAKAKRKQAREAAFLTVKGIVKESAEGRETLPLSSQGHRGSNSRSNENRPAVLTHKNFHRRDASPQEIIAHHTSQGNLPLPFRPLSLATSAPGRPLIFAQNQSLQQQQMSPFQLQPPHPQLHNLPAPSEKSIPESDAATLRESGASPAALDSKDIRPLPNRSNSGGPVIRPISIRHRSRSASSSFLSAMRESLHSVGVGNNANGSIAGANNYNNNTISSVGSAANVTGSGGFGRGIRSSDHTRFGSVSSTASSVLSGHFQERKVRQVFTPILPDELTITVGERLTIAQSFDDGWCIVGRDDPSASGGVELGAVPAWCFIKPVKGLQSERPVRSSSLGVTVQVEDDSPVKMRPDIISWSNF